MSPERTPGLLLARHADERPDVDFLVMDDVHLSYGMVDELAGRYATALAGLGVSRGDAVAILLENSLELVVATFAVNRLGAIWSPVNTDYRGEWLGTTLAAVGARVLLVDGHLLPRVVEVADLVQFEHVVVRNDPVGQHPAGSACHSLAAFAEQPATRPTEQPRPGDVSAVLWTSGTTGRSKGVMQPHGVWLPWAAHHNTLRRYEPGERFYGCTPMYNSTAFIMNVMPALLVGSQACVDQQFSVTDFWDRVRFYDAHHTITLGTMHMYLWGAPPRPDDRDNPLRTQFMTPMPADLVEPWRERFGIETLISGYGQSEVMGATQFRHDADVPAGSCGPPTPLVEVTLLDEDDATVETGATGEICVRPRHPDAIFQGYWDMPEATIQAFRNLWHHTGDLGRFDEGGNLWFVDRKKDATRHKGRSISSFEVEHIARQHPSVLHVAAVGVPDPLLEAEDELMLYVVANPGDTVDPLDLCKFIDANAPYFFVPRYIEVVEELPATPTGKVEKYKLRERGTSPTTWDLHALSDWRPTR